MGVDSGIGNSSPPLPPPPPPVVKPPSPPPPPPKPPALPKPKRPPALAVPTAGALNAAHNAALVAAARSLSARQAAAARRAQYAQIQRNAIAMRTKLSPHIRPAGGFQEQLSAEQDQRVQANKAIIAAQLQQDQAAHFANMERNARFQAVQKMTAGDPRNAKFLEQLTAQLNQDHIKDPLHLDTELYGKVVEAHQAHAAKVATDYRAAVDKLNAFYQFDGKGNIIAAKNPKAFADANAYRKSADFKKIHDEFFRLYGPAGNGSKGANIDFVQNASAIADRQREYLYQQAKDVLFSKMTSLTDDGRNGEIKQSLFDDLLKSRDTGRYLMDAAASYSHADGSASINETLLYEAAKSLIKPDQTSQYWVMQGGRPILKSRTVQEEFDFRRTQYVAELQRQAQLQYNQNRAEAQKKVSLREEFTGKQTFEAKKHDAAVAQALSVSGFDNNSVPTNPGAIQRVVENAMQIWVSQHKDWLNALDKPSGSDPIKLNDTHTMLDRNSAYQAAYNAAEQSFYDSLHTVKPGWMDAVVAVPSVSALLNLANAGVGLTGSGAKAIATLVTGKPAEFVLAGRNYGVKDLPSDVQQRISAEADRLMNDPALMREARARAPRGISAGAMQETVNKLALQQAFEKFGVSWLNNDPKGQLWASQKNLWEGSAGINTGRSPADTKRIVDSLQNFYENFYQSTDVGKNIKALGDYGASPFSPDSGAANLAFGMLFDPLNVLPMNPLTWGERAHAAAEAGRGAGLFVKPFASVKRFVGITDSEIKYVRILRQYGSLSESESHMMLNAIDHELLGLKTQAERQGVMDTVMHKLGILKDSPDGRQIQTLAEHFSIERARAAGVTWQTTAERARLHESEVKAAARAKETERLVAIDRAETVSVAREQKVLEGVQATREAQTAAREAEIAAAKRELSDAKGYKGLSIQRVDQSVAGPMGKNGREVGAQYVHAKPGTPAHIRVDETVLKKSFAEKAWTKGDHATALPANQFKTYAEFKRYAFEHEFQHHVSPKLPHETAVVYESRINDLALHGEHLPATSVDVRAAASEGRVADARALSHEAQIQAHYDAGRIAEGRALNTSEAVSRGGDAAAASPEQVRHLSGLADKTEVALRGATDPVHVAELTSKLSDIRSEITRVQKVIDDARVVAHPVPTTPTRSVDELLSGLSEARFNLTDGMERYRPDAPAALKTPKTIEEERVFLNVLQETAAVIGNAEFSSAAIGELSKSIAIARKLEGGPAMVKDLSNRISKHLAELRGATAKTRSNSIRDARIAMAQEALLRVSDLTEEQWLQREMQSARAARDAAKTKIEKDIAFTRIKNAQRVLDKIAVEKTGTGYASFAARDRFVNRIGALLGRDASETVNPSLVSPFVTGVAGAEVEQGRAYYRSWADSAETLAEPTSLRPKTASETFVTHGPAIEKMIDLHPIANDLINLGLSEDIARIIKPSEILHNPEEFVASREFKDAANWIDHMKDALDSKVAAITGDRAYTVDHYLSDRLLHGGDHYDVRLFEHHDSILAPKIAAARGWKSNTYTTLRKALKPRSEDFVPMISVLDKDIRVVLAKARFAKEHGVDIQRYNQARRVLGRPMVRKRVGTQLAEKAAAAGGVYDEAFLALRKSATEEESKRLIQQLAGGEMYGKPASEILTEFRARYQFDGAIKQLPPDPISDFQHWTLFHAAENLLGAEIGTKEFKAALQAHGQAPPFTNRVAMREWLVKHGVWTPRTSELIDQGRASWSLADENAYYWKNWGFAPDWADPQLLEPGQKWGNALMDRGAYGQMLRDQGVFNDGIEARFATAAMSKDEILALRIAGDPKLGLAGERDLLAMRRYAMERYGSLVHENGVFHAMPWLMNPEEYRSYLSNGATKTIPKGMIKTAEELTAVEAIIKKSLDKHFDAAVFRGREVSREEFFALTSKITDEVFSHPIWDKTGRAGKIFRFQSDFRKALVMSQIGFATTNVIDSFLKEGMIRYTDRAFLRGDISETAKALHLVDFGMDRGTQLIGKEKLVGYNRLVSAAAGETDHAILDSIRGFSEIPAVVSGLFENAAKLRLARSMYDEALARAIKSGIDPKLADGIARKFIGERVARMWPTVGDGPIERFFNHISPFLSYQFKNHVLFIREAAANPFVFSQLNRIGDFIEAQNRANWAKENPGKPFDEKTARWLALPWTHGTDTVFFDAGVWTDAQRGIKPLYDLASGKATVSKLVGSFVRLAGASDINVVGGILNALDIPMTYGWREIYNSKGYSTGQYERVPVPWAAPWGVEANSANSFWPLEILNNAQKFNADGSLSAGDWTQLFGQFAFFGGLRPYDKMTGLNAYYITLKNADPKAAAAFLLTPDGMALKQHWQDRVFASYVDKSVLDLLKVQGPDDVKHYIQTPEWVAQVKSDRAGLHDLMAKWDQKIWALDPTSQAYKDARLQAMTARYVWYNTHPDLYEADAFFRTPAEWAALDQSWKTDSEVQTYFNLFSKAPQKADYKTISEFQAALKTYRDAGLLYLNTHPNAAAVIQGTHNSFDNIKNTMEQSWFATLDRIGNRGIAIEVAKQAHDYPLVDQLYVANELDYSTLGVDQAVTFFDPKTDYKAISAFDRERERDPQLIAQNLVQKISVLPDFNKWRYDRATPAGRAKIETDNKYATGMAAIIKQAKASGNFAYTFSNLIRKNPFLMNEYFNRKPGKRDSWAATQSYINIIGKYGALTKQGNFAAASKYFDTLPSWVKARYFEKHPDRKARAQQNMQYISLMGKWHQFNVRKDYAAGSAFFKSMPKWAQDRYLAKHPHGASSAYSRAMGGWVGLLHQKKFTEADIYFKHLPQWVQDRYHAGHPQTAYSKAIGGWAQLMGQKRYAEADKYFKSMPKAFQDRYHSKHPAGDYAKQMGHWVDLLKAGKKAEATAYFKSLPKATQDRYYVKHPNARLQNDIHRVGQLGSYFAGTDAWRAQYLKDNPEFAAWLNKNNKTQSDRFRLVTAAYKGLPHDDPWLRRIFRAQYQDVFGPQATAGPAIAKVNKFLAAHPEFLPKWTSWFNGIWASYAEEQKHTKTVGRPIVFDHTRQRESGINRPTPQHGMSAEWVRKHSLA